MKIGFMFSWVLIPSLVVFVLIKKSRVLIYIKGVYISYLSMFIYIYTSTNDGWLIYILGSIVRDNKLLRTIE